MESLSRVLFSRLRPARSDVTTSVTRKANQVDQERRAPLETETLACPADFLFLRHFLCQPPLPCNQATRPTPSIHLRPLQVCKQATKRTSRPNCPSLRPDAAAAAALLRTYRRKKTRLTAVCKQYLRRSHHQCKQAVANTPCSQ